MKRTLSVGGLLVAALSVPPAQADASRSVEEAEPGAMVVIGTRAPTDPALLREVQIARGALSSLYGSNAMGGVVSVETVAAEDLLRPGPVSELTSRLSLSRQEIDEPAADLALLEQSLVLGWRGRFAEAFDKRDDDTRLPGYGLHDLQLAWRITPALESALRLRNLGDKVWYRPDGSLGDGRSLFATLSLQW